MAAKKTYSTMARIHQPQCVAPCARREKVFLKAYRNGTEASSEIGYYFRFYDTDRPHQDPSDRAPTEVFTSGPMEASPGRLRGCSTADASTSGLRRIAGLSLNMTAFLSR